MSRVIIEDAGWQAIMADPRLANARRKLSFHEIRLIVQHARNSNSDPTGEDPKGLSAPASQSGLSESEGIAQPDVAQNRPPEP